MLHRSKKKETKNPHNTVNQVESYWQDAFFLKVVGVWTLNNKSK